MTWSAARRPRSKICARWRWRSVACWRTPAGSRRCSARSTWPAGCSSLPWWERHLSFLYRIKTYLICEKTWHFILYQNWGFAQNSGGFLSLNCSWNEINLLLSVKWVHIAIGMRIINSYRIIEQAEITQFILLPSLSSNISGTWIHYCNNLQILRVPQGCPEFISLIIWLSFPWLSYRIWNPGYFSCNTYLSTLK